MNSVQSILERTSRHLAQVSVVLLNLTFVLLLAGILLRELRIPAGWIAELAQIFTIWLVFLMLGESTLTERHIRIDYFYEKLPARPRRALDLGTLTTNVLLSLVILVSGVVASIRFANSNTPAARLPSSVLFLAAVAGGLLLLAIYTHRFAVDHLGAWQE